MENVIRVSLGVLRSIADISTTADWAECPGRIRLSSADHGDLFTIAHSPILHSRDGAKWKGKVCSGTRQLGPTLTNWPSIRAVWFADSGMNMAGNTARTTFQCPLETRTDSLPCSGN